MRRFVCRVVGVGLLVLAGVALAHTATVHDQHVTVYSVTPDDTVQVIGLTHRTYLLDYGGPRVLILFRTTFGTGVLTHGHRNDPRMLPTQ